MAYKTQYKKQDGGFYFNDYEIHVKAKTLKEATELVREHHGVDVTIEPVKVEVPKRNEKDKSV